MGDFTIEDMLAMQQALQEKYKDKWEPIGPEAGKHKLLWMLGEVGEVSTLSRKTETKRLLRMQKLLSGKLNDVPSGRLFRADSGFLQMCQSL